MESFVPGKETYYWRVGSSQAKDSDDQRSPVYKTNLFVCGLETIKAKSDDQIELKAERQRQFYVDDLTTDTGKNNAVYAFGKEKWIDSFELGFDDA